MMAIRERAALVDTRTSLVNTARGLTKAMGERLPACDADALDVGKLCTLPASMKETLRPSLEQVESLTEKIKQADAQLEQIARIEYPETELLRQVSGVEGATIGAVSAGNFCGNDLLVRTRMR